MFKGYLEELKKQKEKNTLEYYSNIDEVDEGTSFEVIVYPLKGYDVLLKLQGVLRVFSTPALSFNPYDDGIHLDCELSFYDENDNHIQPSDSEKSNIEYWVFNELI